MEKNIKASSPSKGKSSSKKKSIDKVDVEDVNIIKDMEPFN
jgi:hypothetical protein